MALDAALLALAARELKQTLLDAKIDKIFEPTRDEVVITLRTRTDTFKLLLSARSGSARACLTQDTFENPAVPPSFCMLLRKHLTGGRLVDLRVEPGDRLAFFEFQCTNEMGDLVRNILAVELMGRYSNRCWCRTAASSTPSSGWILRIPRSASCCRALHTLCPRSPTSRICSQ